MSDQTEPNRTVQGDSLAGLRTFLRQKELALHEAIVVVQAAAERSFSGQEILALRVVTEIAQAGAQLAGDVIGLMPPPPEHSQEQPR